MSGRFYVSDSYTLGFTAPTTLHLPGPANSSTSFGPDEVVRVEWTGGDLGVVVYQDSLQGANLDVMLALYDVTAGQPAPGWTAVNGGAPLAFLSPYGSAPNGVLMNVVCRYGQHARASYHLPEPVVVGTTTPPTPDRQYQVGARLVVNCGVGGTLAYQYWMHGLLGAAASEPPPPPPPPTTSMFTLTTPTGTYQWPVTDLG